MTGSAACMPSSSRAGIEAAGLCNGVHAYLHQVEQGRVPWEWAVLCRDCFIRGLSAVIAADTWTNFDHDTWIYLLQHLELFLRQQGGPSVEEWLERTCRVLIAIRDEGWELSTEDQEFVGASLQPFLLGQAGRLG